MFNEAAALVYPAAALEAGKSLASQRVLPISVRRKGQVEPGLLVIGDAALFGFFALEATLHTAAQQFTITPGPDGSVVMEAMLMLNHEKIMRLQLDPSQAAVQDYMQACLEHKQLGFHFYNQDTGRMVDWSSPLSEEEIAWFAWYVPQLSRLKPQAGFAKAAELMAQEPAEPGIPDLSFRFQATSEPELLIQNTRKFYIPRENLSL